MDTLVRARETSMKVARVQRRIWLIQTVLVPVAAVVGVVIAIAAARVLWSRRPLPSAAAPTLPAEPAGLNSASNGN